MVGSVLINSLKTALKMAGKRISKGAKFISNSKIGKWVGEGAQKVSSRLLKNVGTKKWFGRAVMLIRSNRKMSGVVGKLGTALKSSGGILGLFGRGLSIFDTDWRSPKEFRKDMNEKRRMVKELKVKRDNLIKKELEAQKNLKDPIVTEGLETSEEKIDEMAKHLSIMKETLGKVRADSFSANQKISGFENYQVKANKQIADAIDYGTQTNMKTVAAGLEDVKDVTKAVTASSTQSIVGEISAKIDTIEEQRKKEEEFRRKNSWKKKVLEFVLFAADWFLNWRFKLMMIAVKLGAFLLAGLGVLAIKHIVPIKALIGSGFKGIASFIAMKLNQAMFWVLSKITTALGWVAKKLLGAVNWVWQSIGGLLGKFLGSWVQEKVQSGSATITGVMEKIHGSITKAVVGKLDQWKDDAKGFAKEYLDDAMKVYSAKAKAREAEDKDSHKNLDNQSPEGIRETMISKADAKSSDAEVNSSKQDKGILGGIFSKVQDVADSSLDGAAKVNEEFGIQTKVEEVKSKATSVVNKGKQAITSVVKSEKFKEVQTKVEKESHEKLDNLNSKISDLSKALHEKAWGKQNSPEVAQTQAPTKIEFETSANKFKNRV